MKKVSIIIVLVIILNLFLLSGCSAAKFSNAGELTFLRYYIDYTTLDITDKPYSDWNDCQFEFEVFFDKRVQDQVAISLKILRDVEPPLNYVVQGNAQNMADIKAIIEEYKIYSWKGSSGASFSSASSRVAYDITADIENASFEISDLSKIPEKYIEGLEALSSYLMQCIETLPPYKIAKEDIPLMLNIMLPESDELFIYDERRRPDVEPFATLDTSQKESLNDLFSRLIDLYNNKIQSVHYTLDRNAGVWAYITVGNDGADTEWIDQDIRYAFQNSIFSPDDFDSLSEIISGLQDSNM